MQMHNGKKYTYNCLKWELIKKKVWFTSDTFLTGISFYFNEKLSHHLLTK